MVGNLSIRHVTRVFEKTRPEEDTVTAFRDLSIDIEPGKFVSFIGPSGCGKSTLLRIVSGLDEPTEGEVFLDGEAVKEPGSEIGFAFQQANLFPWMTIRDNVAFGLKARHIYKEKKKDVDEFIRLVGLEDFRHAYPHQVSGGMAQRASLARALVGHPKVLLLDEPLGALDAFTRMNMQDEIMRIWRESGMTMLMVTHDVDEAVYLSDQVVIMTPRPAKIQETVVINLPRPRARNQDVFISYRKRILDALNYGGVIHQPEYNL